VVDGAVRRGAVGWGPAPRALTVGSALVDGVAAGAPLPPDRTGAAAGWLVGLAGAEDGAGAPGPG